MFRKCCRLYLLVFADSSLILGKECGALRVSCCDLEPSWTALTKSSTAVPAVGGGTRKGDAPSGAYSRKPGKSKQSAQDASKGFDQLKDSAHSLAVEFLSYEAGLRIFEGIKGAVESSIEFAASMGKLQEKTGLSAVSLQVWAAAAKRVDVR